MSLEFFILLQTFLRRKTYNVKQLSQVELKVSELLSLQQLPARDTGRKVQTAEYIDTHIDNVL